MKAFQILLSFLLMGLFFAACNKRSEIQADALPEETSDSIALDTLQEETTTAPQEATPPQKADELFDDFVFAFMKNKRFQKSRIVFPLSHIVDGQRRGIARAKWRFDSMYSRREVYTLIFDSRKAEKMAKDTSLRHVVVEELNLTEERVKSYVFQRQNTEWKLTELRETDMDETENGDFYVFYRSFSSDETFQKQHIAAPLEFSTYDEETFERFDGFISPDQWKDFAPELPKNELTNILYGQTYGNSNLRILKISSLSGGMNCVLTFKRQNGKWMLTKLDN